ncbi:MAG TPA: acylglycerol kinase family protein [Allosphingosinicella sp.]|nr:acylglycerol kinase family protein [Allosphingosinicella sp.]
MARVALLSNPRSTGNRALLPRVRSFCAAHKDIFHYEVEHADQIGTALATIALVNPKVLVINGGDGTVQAALTEIHNGRHFGDSPPPVAVLPNGKTNLIAQDLGASGDPLEALEHVLKLARADLAPHIVERELISLSRGPGSPQLGMFLGGAGLAETMLYCRHKIYPLGLPNGLAHVLALLLGLLGVLVGRRLTFLPPRPIPLKVSVLKRGEWTGAFAFLMVTTLQRLLFKGHMPGIGARTGAMQLLVIDRNILALVGAFVAALRGRLGRKRLSGVHLERGDEIRIEGEQQSVILDGELFEADRGRPIVLTPTAPVPFLCLAA